MSERQVKQKHMPSKRKMILNCNDWDEEKWREGGKEQEIPNWLQVTSLLKNRCSPLKYSFEAFRRRKKNEFRSRRGRCNNHNHSATCHTNEMLRAPHSDDLVLRHITSITNQMQRYKNWYKSYFCIVLFSESRWMRDLSRFEATAYCKQRLHCRKVFSRYRKKSTMNLSSCWRDC